MKNSQKIIAMSKPGTAIYALTFRPDPRIDFLVKEETRFIKQYSTKTNISLRAKVVFQDEVALVITLFKINNESSRIFTTFWDYYDEGGDMVFTLASKQPDIAFHLYGDTNTIEQSILLANSFKDFFEKAIKKISQIPRWDKERFESAKKKLIDNFLNVHLLWEQKE
ncbi:MAG: hypothetical protein N3A59_03935 [Thermodesulfovibrionales bacterium]|nr:hypothetical protein [Thermodesulfovibrionales bacterium]